jgi:cytochrome c-type biogenesis protein CcmE
MKKLAFLALLAACGSAKSHDDAVHFRHVYEIMIDPNPPLDQEMVVQGYVATDSITRRDTDIRFVMEDHGASLDAVLHGPPPDGLKDGADVYVHGRLSRVAGHLELAASEVMVKLPGFDPPTPAGADPR